jgi:hypothetical protein
MQTKYVCKGPHRIFVPDVAQVVNEGLIHIFLVCTDCGESDMKTFEVSRNAKLLKQK